MAEGGEGGSGHKSVIVVTWASENREMLALLKRQLAMAKIPFVVNPGGTWFASMEKTLARYQAMAEKYSDYENIVFCDAFDVLFYGTRDSLVEALRQRRGAIGGGAFFAAERNCFPDKYLAPFFHDTRTPWRYVNGGLFGGMPGAVIDFCERIRTRESYSFGKHLLNQQYLNLLLCGGDPAAQVDSDGAIFYCMQQETDAPALTFQNGAPFNSLSGTRPHFIHFNGNWPPLDFLIQREISRLQGEDEKQLGERLSERFQKVMTVLDGATCQ